jgi:hypothetical protein
MARYADLILDDKTKTLPEVTITGVSERQKAHDDSLALYNQGWNNYIERSIGSQRVLRPGDPMYLNYARGDGKPVVISQRGYNPTGKTHPVTNIERDLGDLNSNDPIQPIGTYEGSRSDVPQFAYKKPVHNPADYNITPMTQRDIAAPTTSIPGPQKIRNEHRQPNPSYPTLKTVFINNVPWWTENENGERLPYVDGIAPVPTYEFAYPNFKRGEKTTMGSLILEKK